jgi:hypothetical protein
MVMSIRIVRQLEQVIEPYRMTFKEMKERKERNVSAKKGKYQNIYGGR